MSEQEKRELQNHIEQLAWNNRIYLTFVPSLFDAGAWIEPYSRRKVAMIAPVEDVSTYMGALHEIGHHAAGHTDIPAGSRAGRKDRLDKEAEAWEWALDNSIIPTTEEVWDEIRYSLGSYLYTTLENPGYFGEPGDTFYRLSNRVGGIKPVKATPDDDRAWS